MGNIFYILCLLHYTVSKTVCFQVEIGSVCVCVCVCMESSCFRLVLQFRIHLLIFHLKTKTDLLFETFL